ncbi:hypothetical protein SARC_01465 [Sphaeroforma arctica JP610]|uniref:Uncharacterized protein n=1 Tax=Sphaeroforma arctica JP610 TaxID=667725 RepID=A0A0L0GDM8_9EUKA|nr:hypothetical protein SARC_01465 [Sphaeroforma arctica JP610]KNC86368.1 hypothetical protein SARC_01465 [Sphaeroforma arctica JP610]|eukprot:XP_014160270.1 hypothetical protein SARC_01465 [Sphaeroforma arctica JP610]
MSIDDCPILMAEVSPDPVKAVNPPLMQVKSKENKDGTIAFSKVCGNFRRSSMLKIHVLLQSTQGCTKKRSRTGDEDSKAVKRRKENTGDVDASANDDEDDDAEEEENVVLDETSEFAQNLMRQWEAQMGDAGDQSSDDDGEYDLYSDLTFGVWLLSDGSKTENQIELMDEESLENCQQVITEALAELKPKRIKSRTTPKAGAAAAVTANKHLPAADEEIYLTLKPAGNSVAFENADVHAKLLAMNLQYAQGQFLCFAEITEADGGEDTDCIFSVDVNLNAKSGETSATPEPTHKRDSIKMGFYLPHNVAPREVVQLLVKTATTLQREVGGVIHMDRYKDDEALEAVVKRVDRLCTTMEEELGVYPGTMDAHFLYN